MRFFMRWPAVERRAVGVEFVGPLSGEIAERALLLLRTADGLVVDVGDVADVLHLARTELQFEQAADDVVDDEGAEIADVRRGVNRGASIIEAEHAVRVRRCQRFELTLERIEELDGHEMVKGS